MPGTGELTRESKQNDVVKEAMYRIEEICDRKGRRTVKFILMQSTVLFKI